MNENKLSQAPLVAWHVLSSIWVHFGTWGLILGRVGSKSKRSDKKSEKF